MRLAIVQQKGGVGKTTTVTNVAPVLASARDLGLGPYNYRTLVIDVDPQGDASEALGVQSAEQAVGLTDVLLGQTGVFAPIRPTAVPNLWLLPSTPSLEGDDEMRAFYSNPGYRFQLHSAVKHLAQEFDVILFDCPPSRGILFTMVMLAAQRFLVPTSPRSLEKRGLWTLLNAIRTHRERLKSLAAESDQQKRVSVAELMGLLITDLDTTNSNARKAADDLRGQWGDRVFETAIPRNVAVDYAQSRGMTLLDYDRRAPATVAYLSLTAEIIRRAQAGRILP